MEHADTAREYDVIVVGSGAGAMAGAYLAARAGLETLVVERTALLGGTSAYSGAACWLPGTAVQARAEHPESSGDALTYLRSLLAEPADGRLEAFVAGAPALVAALEADPRLEFAWQAFPDYFDRPGRIPGGRSITPLLLPADALGERAALVRPPVDRDRLGRGHRDGPLTQGRALIGRLLWALDGTGHGTVLTSTSMDGLVTDADGRVTGITATTATGRLVLSARRGVLLGAGGFERDAEARAAREVPGRAEWSMAPAGSNTGLAIRAAVEAGAALALLDQGWWCPGLEMPDGAASFTLGLRGGLVVDRHGHRYANESLPYDQFGRAMAASPSRIPSWFVFDSREGGALPAISLPGGKPAEHLSAGTWVQADTLDELAALTGLPLDALSATVSRFNSFADDGVDADFGRGADEYDRFFASPVLVPLAEPPYYAARLVLADLGTKGGLVTDASARVLRPDGSSIPGLYAAGNCAASMTGEVYPGPGIPIGTAMVFASLAVADLLG